MDKAALDKILAKHVAWLRDKDGGVRADLAGANLSGANLFGTNLSRTDLRGANLCEASLCEASLFGANLRGANLSGADLSEANLRWASLFGANLSRANLSEAALYKAELYKANLYGANLCGADLSRANLCGTVGNMREVRSMQITRYPVVWTSDRLWIGCQCMPIQDWWDMDELPSSADSGDDELWRRWKPVLRQVVEMSLEGEGDG